MRDDVGKKFQVVCFRKLADYEGTVSVKNTIVGETDDPALIPWATGVIAGTAVNKSATNMDYDGEYQIDTDYIDCLDPAYAAGTGTPQFGGLTARQLLDLLKGLFDGLNIIGMDVVEVAPRLDPSLAALFAARKIITECWAHHYFKNLARA